MRQDLDPVAIRISDEVDAHREVFVADAAHLLVLLVCGVEVVRCDGEVEFVLAEVIGLLAVVEPGELELVRRLSAVREVDECEIRGVQAVRFLEAERFFVEFQAALEVEDVEVVMCETEFHLTYLQSLKSAEGIGDSIREAACQPPGGRKISSAGRMLRGRRERRVAIRRRDRRQCWAASFPDATIRHFFTESNLFPSCPPRPYGIIGT